MVRLPDFTPLGKTKQRLNHSYVDLHGLSRKNTVFDKLKRRFSQSERDISSLGIDLTQDLNNGMSEACEGNSLIVYNMMTTTSDCLEPNFDSDSGATDSMLPQRRSSTTFDGFSDIIDIIQGKGLTMDSKQSNENGHMQEEDECFDNQGFGCNEVVIANKSLEDQKCAYGISLEREELTYSAPNIDIARKYTNYKESNGDGITKSNKGIMCSNGACANPVWEDGACDNTSVKTPCLADMQGDTNTHNGAEFVEIKTSNSGFHNGMPKPENQLDKQNDFQQEVGPSSRAALKFSTTACNDNEKGQSIASKMSAADYNIVDKSLEMSGLKTKCTKGNLCEDYQQAGDLKTTRLSKITGRFDQKKSCLKTGKDLERSTEFDSIEKEADKSSKANLSKHNTEATIICETSSHDNTSTEYKSRDGADGFLSMSKSEKEMDSPESLISRKTFIHSTKELPFYETDKSMSCTQNSCDERTPRCASEAVKALFVPECELKKASDRSTSRKSSCRERSLSDENILNHKSKSTGRTRRLFSAPDLLRIDSKDKSYLEKIFSERGSRARSMSLKSAMKRRTSEPSANNLRVRFDLSGSKEQERQSASKQGTDASPCSEPKKNWRYVIKKFRIKQPLADMGLIRGTGVSEKNPGNDGERTGCSEKNGKRHNDVASRPEISLESVKEFNLVLPFATQRTIVEEKASEKAAESDFEKSAHSRSGNPLVSKLDDKRETDGSSTPLLHVAASDGNVELLKRLIEVGVDLNTKDSEGWPALHYAILKGHFQCAALLLDSGVDVNCYTDDIIKDYCKAIRQVIMYKQLLENKSQ
ncbi:uncharacterized protein LOC135690610 [Rhopilema esculentum]|uniref:uncharacterized protein LOC135690610 n=1 Tax=Rhopilema esculentum TaxID=499914 RepID=UPI0031E1F529|eukprot:gene1879-16377_t